MIAAALIAGAKGGRLRGASTITQQVMKNFLLSSDRSAERKIKELILASRLEQTLSKDKILELYLNEIFLGQNSFGVAAAAQTYFNKTLGELDAGRGGDAGLAAAGAVRTITRSAPRTRLTERRNYVLREMWRERLYRRGDLRRLGRRAAEIGAGRRLRAVPRRSCRRATISPTRSAASCRATSARTSSSAAACRSARRWTPNCRPRRRGRCATGWRNTTATWASGAAPAR